MLDKYYLFKIGLYRDLNYHLDDSLLFVFEESFLSENIKSEIERIYLELNRLIVDELS